MRRIAILSLLTTFLLALASPAWAAGPGDRDEAQVVLTGGLHVPGGERADTVVVFNGPVRIEGEVRGSAVVFNGSFVLSGTVRDDVVVFNGRVVLAPGARVGGDLVTRQRPSIDPSATVEGSIRRLRNFSISFGFALHGVIWLAYTISTLILGLILVAVARRGLEAGAVVARTRVGLAIAWGAGLFFGLPLAGILLLVTIVGIPLGLAVLLALWFIYTIGYTAALFFVGRMIIRPPRGRFLALLAGWGVMRALGLIPFLGGVLWFVAAVYGLGVLAETASSVGREPAAVPPPPPVPAQA
jgi:cytoskeletal protein CcmA (bactofilin family)